MAGDRGDPGGGLIPPLPPLPPRAVAGGPVDFEAYLAFLDDFFRLFGPPPPPQPKGRYDRVRL